MLLLLQVTDLGAVLHMVGGTAASAMIFLLPGLLLMNAAIIKATTSYATFSQVCGKKGRCESLGLWFRVGLGA